MGAGASTSPPEPAPAPFVNLTGRSPAHIPRGSTVEAFLRSQSKLRDPRLGLYCFIGCAQKALARHARVEDPRDLFRVVWSFLKPLQGAAKLPPRGRRSIYGDRNDGRYGLAS